MKNCSIGSDDGEFGKFSTLSTKQVNFLAIPKWVNSDDKNAGTLVVNRMPSESSTSC